jgi:hypothetical protein
MRKEGRKERNNRLSHAFEEEGKKKLAGFVQNTEKSEEL